MLAFSADLATFLYLLPVLLLWLLRARRDMDPAECASLVAVAVAGDLLLMLVGALFMRLEYAVVLSRVLWLVGGLGYLVYRYKKRGVAPALPKFVDIWLLLELLAVAYVAVKLSALMSRECHNADRGWHIPLAGSLRGQGLPFSNVYDPTRPLAYHYTGDVLGVALQTLSGVRLHSSLALTLGHDIMFALSGVAMALLGRALGYRGVTAAVLAGLALLLAGPFTVVAEDPKLTSFSVVCFYRISFRPHVSLAALMLVGLLAALLSRMRPTERAIDRGLRKLPIAWPSLLLIVAAMCVTDEATVALLGLGLGAAWLFEPRILADKRWHGALILVGMAAAVIVPQLVLGGSLSPGAPSHDFEWVRPRAPGYYNAPINLTDKRGRWAIINDLGPQFLILLAGVWTLLRKPSRSALAFVSFGAVVFGFGYVLLTRIDMDKMPVENHRFWTAPMLLLPVLGLLWLREAKDVFPKFLIVAALGGSGLSALDWIYSPTGKARLCTPPSRYRSAYDFYKVDCRKFTGATFGEPVHAAYLEAGAAYLYAGCRPTFTAGPTHRVWKHTAIGAAQSGPKALADVSANMVSADANLVVVCLRKNSRDPICTEARKQGSCVPAGRELERCELSPEARRALLPNAPPAAPPRAADDDNDDQPSQSPNL